MAEPRGIAPLEPKLYRDLVRRELAEDLGRAGDVTTKAVLPVDLPARGRIVARATGKLAGLEVALFAFEEMDGEVRFERRCADGDDLRPEDVLVEIEGRSGALLAAERTALNILSHLSGVATSTQRLVAVLEGTPTVVSCTRKTLPGLRALEKYAVRVGGGRNHRFGLDDAVLIKDNHIALVGSVGEAVRRARENSGHRVRIEVEVESLDQLAEALTGGADAVLLDNMRGSELRAAVELARGRVVLEASGGLDESTLREVADAGVDVVSVGSITHSAPALDLSMEIEPVTPSSRLHRAGTPGATR